MTVTDQFDFGPDKFHALGVARLVDLTALGTRGDGGDSRLRAGMRTDGPVPDINGLGGDVQYGVASCAEMASTPALGHCPAGATYAALGDDIGFMPITKSITVAAATTWPSAHFSGTVTGLPVQLVAGGPDGSASAIAKVGTVLDRAHPFVSSSSLFGEISTQTSQLLSELKTSSEVVILASLLIAGCSLAVTTASGMSERKRPFSLLRLTGVPIGVLRRVVVLETAAPLIVIALASAIIGLVASELFLRSQLGLTLRPPGGPYYLIVTGGLLGSLAIIGTTLPLLNRITRPEDARIE